VPCLLLLVGAGAVSFVMHDSWRCGAARVSLCVQHDLGLAIHHEVNALDRTRHDERSVCDVMSRALGDVTLIQIVMNQLPLLSRSGSRPIHHPTGGSPSSPPLR
jgi:hypothetical protein